MKQANLFARSHCMKVAAAGLGLFLAGCASMIPQAKPPAPLMSAFNPAAVEWARSAGTATIEGQAFLKTRGGDVKYGAGNDVLLVPVSPHTEEWFNRAVLREERVVDLGTELVPYVKSTTSDGSGRFRFANVAAGEYYVVTTVTWEVPSGSAYIGPSTQGGKLGMKVRATDGQAESIIVTR